MADLTQLARNLRAASTDAERLLWSRLRGHRFFGLKFKRQQQIRPYIVDFVCFEKDLIIELDGGQHAEQRDALLAERGFRVRRF